MITTPLTKWEPEVLKQAVPPLHIPPPIADPLEAALVSKTTAFKSAIVTSNELAGLELPTREDVVAPFFKAGDLGYVYGARGSGKSWVTLLLSNAIASGTDFAGQKIRRARRVLFVDGEMPIGDVRERQAALTKENPEGLLFLSHERLYHTSDEMLDLADRTAQQALERIVKEEAIDVLVLDNLSCLFYGVKENEADAWEAILPWLLQLRRMQVAVVIVAHAGRNGEMRGTSRREDQAFWILKVTAADVPPGLKGCKFRTQFTKNRNAVNDDCPPLEWTLTAGEQGRMSIISRPVTHDEAVLSLIAGGLSRATEIAEEIGVSRGRVSQIAASLSTRNLVRIAGREYHLTEAGVSRLARDNGTLDSAKRTTSPLPGL